MKTLFMLIYIASITTVIALVSVIAEVITLRNAKKHKKQAALNFGRPATLDYIRTNLFFGSETEPIVVHFFKQITLDTQMSEMVIGTGVISHPAFPKEPAYFVLVFKPGVPIITDGKQQYRLKKLQDDAWFLDLW